MRIEAEEQLSSVLEAFPGLVLTSVDDQSRCAIYVGSIGFDSKPDNLPRISDAFDVRIVLPLDGSVTLPSAEEIGGRIQRVPYFHVNTTGTLCLGAEAEVVRKFSDDPSLDGFIRNLVVPFLYAHVHFIRFGSWPWGELAHGTEGTFENYGQKLGIEGEDEIAWVLRMVAANRYRGHVDCPCKSGKRLRACHGEYVRSLFDLPVRKVVFKDFISYLARKGKKNGKYDRRFLSRRLIACWKAFDAGKLH